MLNSDTFLDREAQLQNPEAMNNKALDAIALRLAAGLKGKVDRGSLRVEFHKTSAIIEGLITFGSIKIVVEALPASENVDDERRFGKIGVVVTNSYKDQEEWRKVEGGNWELVSTKRPGAAAAGLDKEVVFAPDILEYIAITLGSVELKEQVPERRVTTVRRSLRELFAGLNQ